MTCKERLVKLAKECGYENLHQVALATGIESGNLYSNISGKFDVSVKRMFIIANTFRRPVEDVMEVFYPEQLKKNRQIVKKGEK